MIRVMRIYEIAWSPSQKGDTDKQVCPCHPSPIASPKSVIIRMIFAKDAKKIQSPQSPIL
ncbi:MAG: hypothetical protein U9O82_02975, partial [Thermodesulfobacteriota bacterium]|nr:hypothetical protein [Thermodesulfobacteriota bacterium]